MAWILIGVIFLGLAFMAYPVIRALAAPGKVERDSGWKRLGWGLYKSGPNGGPFREDGQQENADKPT